MKMLIALLLIASFASAQTPAKAIPARSSDHKNLAKCVVDVAAIAKEKEDVLSAWKDVTLERANLAVENKRLQEEISDLKARFEKLMATGKQLLDFNQQVIDEYMKTVKERNEIAEKYNSVLHQANYEIEIANSRLARQAQISNTLAIYQMMPRYTPPQTINLNVTNCTAYPALCIH